MVSKDVPAGESWTGYPARPLAEHLKILANLNRLFKNKKK
jgi:UDP-3-O-[3-hydroxymyristoyl] glucosamine N-acyltransferase